MPKLKLTRFRRDECRRKVLEALRGLPRVGTSGRRVVASHREASDAAGVSLHGTLRILEALAIDGVISVWPCVGRVPDLRRRIELFAMPEDGPGVTVAPSDRPGPPDLTEAGPGVASRVVGEPGFHDR